MYWKRVQAARNTKGNYSPVTLNPSFKVSIIFHGKKPTPGSMRATEYLTLRENLYGGADKYR